MEWTVTDGHGGCPLWIFIGPTYCGKPLLSRVFTLSGMPFNQTPMGKALQNSNPQLRFCINMSALRVYGLFEQPKIFSE